jgi:hypothetical protein
MLVDVEELPDRRPESLEVVDRPPVQCGVVRKIEPAVLRQPVQIAADLGGLPHVRGRCPQQLWSVHR